MLLYFALSGLLNHGHHNNHIKISGSDKIVLLLSPAIRYFSLTFALMQKQQKIKTHLRRLLRTATSRTYLLFPPGA
jgi:hypothetical protein